MAAATKIQWCHHTFNPWRGCTKISPGCTNCYAETMSHRNPKVLGVWGDKAQRSIAVESYWRQPFLWDKTARQEGERRRVFCLSLGDAFEDRPELVEPRSRVWSTIRQTPNLDWLLLTKRPENWRKCWPLVSVPGHVSQNEGDGKTWERFPNVWLGCSVEDQKRADERIPHLLQVPAAVRFVSYEPALGPVDFGRVSCTKELDSEGASYYDALKGYSYWPHGCEFGISGPSLDWIIVGGESGPHARPFDLAWARSLRDQCEAAGVPYFLKQCGSSPFDSDAALTVPGAQIKMSYEQAVEPANLDLLGQTLDAMKVHFRDKKGGDMSEWPQDLKVREFPGHTKACAS